MNDLSKNMDNFFNNLIETMPNNSSGGYNNSNKYYNKNNSSNFYKSYVEHNLLLLFLLAILIIIIITYFYWNNDIKKTIDKNNNINITEDFPIEEENIEFLDNVDKETLLNIIDELSSVNEQQYELQQKIKQQQEQYDNLKSKINNNSGFDNYQNIKDNNILNIDGVYVQAPYK